MHIARKIGHSALLLGLLLATAARGQETPATPPVPALLPIPPYAGPIIERPFLSGDWGGTRTDWANHGVQINLDWTQYFQSIVDGGVNESSQYGGHLDYVVNLDLLRMGTPIHGIVKIRAESRYGSSVNNDVGTVLPVNTAAFFPMTDDLDEDIPVSLTNLYYTHIVSEKLFLLAGKLDTLDADPNEFASGRGKSQFMNANFLFNSALALRLPYSSLGAGLLWMPAHNFSIAASIINTVDSSTSSGFDDFGDGVTTSIEADWQYRFGDLPGGMNVGALYSFDQDFAEIGGRIILQPGQGLDIETEDDTWALYWSGWQYLSIEGKAEHPIRAGDGVPDHEGFGVFARLGLADGDTNPVEWSASAGIGGRGVIPSRNNDTFGIGYYYTHFQQTRLTGPLSLEDHSQGVELFYNVAITPAANLTFDVQLDDPAPSDTDTAVILGVRLNVAF